MSIIILREITIPLSSSLFSCLLNEFGVSNVRCHTSVLRRKVFNKKKVLQRDLTRSDENVSVCLRDLICADEN